MLLHDIAVLAAHRNPDGVAIHFEGRSISYLELLEQTLRLADALRGLAEPGARVAILSENCPEYVSAYYGVPAARMVLTTINYRLSAREILYILQDSEPAILLVAAAYLPLVESLKAQVPSLRHIFLLDDEFLPDGGGAAYPGFAALLESGRPVLPETPPDEDDVAWLMYTSGTTGRPKGAMLTHRNLMTSICNTAIAHDFRRDEVALYMFPQFHVTGHIFGVYNLNCYPVVLLKSFDPLRFMEAAQQHRVTLCAIAPTMLAMLLDHPQVNDYDLSGLHQMAYGASAMPGEVLRRAFARFPGLGFGTGFGMTELAGNVAYFGRDDHIDALEHDVSRLSSSGRQMPLSMIRILDERDRDVAAGQPGEIVVKGAQVMKGYWRNPVATRASFVDGWFRTGDIGCWDERRNLYIVDRKKDMILSGGENVYSREVEDILYEHPAIAEAAVIGLPDVTWGEVVAAVIRLRPGMECDADAVDRHCRARIAGYKRPRRIFFVDELPKNASGKILKHLLRETMAAANPQ